MSFKHRHIHRIGLSLMHGIDYCTILVLTLINCTITGQDKTKDMD